MIEKGTLIVDGVAFHWKIESYYYKPGQDSERFEAQVWRFITDANGKMIDQYCHSHYADDVNTVRGLCAQRHAQVRDEEIPNLLAERRSRTTEQGG